MVNLHGNPQKMLGMKRFHLQPGTKGLYKQYTHPSLGMHIYIIIYYLKYGKDTGETC